LNIDKRALKAIIEKSKPTDLLVAHVDSTDKDSTKAAIKQIELFIKHSQDYIVTVVKR
jgi:hypothetical protein